MSDRADIREALYNEMARVSILGINEVTNEIPEYRYLDDSWNARTRGLGGTPQNPVTVAGTTVFCYSFPSSSGLSLLSRLYSYC